ncbi:MAG: tRNA 2-selenouridine(34) synthase MnmH, partial [Azonexus sp.]|nr:tRNA 2-selenouridine(34) synthase MnmH [Azonexus sp.]
VSGPTGSAKTRILQRMGDLGAQVLDLEGLAAHKGSVLGRVPNQIQPSQKWFETQLYASLSAFDRGQPVFIESESRKIGELRLPESLFVAMQQARGTEIVTAREDRVAFLLADYAYFMRDPDALARRLDGLRPLLGHERINDWHAQIENGEFAALTESLLALHYDPLYARAQQRDYSQQPRQPLMAGALDDREIERLARCLMARVQN